MEPLEIRENEVFETLRKLKSFNFVVIGGYAVNAYATLPRFSADCDIVIENGTDLVRIEEALLEFGYKRMKSKVQGTEFVRYIKPLTFPFKVSFDIMIGKVIDRQTNTSIPAKWIFTNSAVRLLKGKTIREELNLRIINLDALFVIKMISCRPTDIRDLFMLATLVKDKGWIKQQIESLYNFDKRFKKVKTEINSKQFRDGLQGAYGLLDDQIFEKSKAEIIALGVQ